MALRRASSRALVFVVSMLAAAAGIAVACLPDLETTPFPVPGGDSGAICGDGIIDWEGGEQCDPGKPDVSVPGCSQTCQLVCDAGKLPAYVDYSSNHCYFLLSQEAGTSSAAAAGCEAQGAHVITLGSGAELSAVSAHIGSINESWLGLDPTPPVDGGAFTYSAVIDEPGLGPRADCRGCFGPPYTKDGLAARPGQAGTDAGCVTWILTTEPRWYATDCESSFPAICEREPVGSRRAAHGCNGLACFTVPSTLSEPKLYEWYGSDRTDASAAASSCTVLSSADAGETASLVVFESPEEREQVFYELLHLPGNTPDSFWIGLTSSIDGGGPLEWTWDNGYLEQRYLLPWGDHEPTATQPGVRAFALQTGDGYGSQAATYDTQLSHAHDPPDGGDGGAEVHGVLCQVTH